jgi:hypothetical protein
MNEQYPRHLGEPGKHRVLQFRDYPKRSATVSQDILDYLAGHNIPYDKLAGEEHSYVTDGAITFLTHGKTTNAYQLRYCPSRVRFGKMLRFDIPAGIDMDDHLYHTSVGRKGGVVICEGSADALAAYSHGYTGISLLGANLTENRALMLKETIQAHFSGPGGMNYPFPPVFIPDNDPQGQKAVERMARYNVGVRVAQLPLGAKDLCDLEYNDRELFLKEVLMA